LRRFSLHMERARELYAQGFMVECAKELREAIQLDPANAAAHLLLAQALDDMEDEANARSEAEAATRLDPSAESYILLGTLQLKSNQAELARQQAETALRLEPGNATALALQQAAAARLPQAQ
jgi:Flp pilus assembly protein TadD